MTDDQWRGRLVASIRMARFESTRLSDTDEVDEAIADAVLKCLGLSVETGVRDTQHQDLGEATVMPGLPVGSRRYRGATRLVTSWKET